jgi:prepilin-type N-terminal cleavage/methylation domain-containing protein
MRYLRNEIGVLMRQVVNIESTAAIGTKNVGACTPERTTLGDKHGNPLLVHSQLVSLQGLTGISNVEAGVSLKRRAENFGYCPGRTRGRRLSHCSEPVPPSSCCATDRWVTNAKSGRGVPMANHYCRGTTRGEKRNAAGFTAIEILVVLVISLIAAAMAIPGYTSMTRYLRIAGDLRELNGITAEAKMRAAQNYTHARVYADLNANTFHLDVWDASANGGAGCWKTEGDPLPNRCFTTGGGSPVQPLSTGVVFGFGTAVGGGLNPQTTIQQAPACNTLVAGMTGGSADANSACIEFNSRGIPVGAGNSPIQIPSALYVTDSDEVYGLTVIATGLMQQWETSASNTAWSAR